MNDEGQLLTAQDMAGFLNVDQRTLTTMADKGEIPAYRLGKLWRFSRDEVLRSIRRGSPPTQDEGKALA